MALTNSPHPEEPAQQASRRTHSADPLRTPRPDDTIFAPATAAGRAGIAVVRISGPATCAALAALSCVVPKPRHAARARFAERASGEAIDDGLVLFFPGPASVTGEDVAELHLHGGRAIIEAVTAVLAFVPGLRLAEPGEFTRRAFAHGKLDLTAAEAVADLVGAETAAQRRQALRQLDGELGRLYDEWRQSLLRAAAHVEAAIDFPEEGLPETLDEGARRAVEDLIGEIDRHLADNRRGEILRDGVSVAILGPPNVGKSSLINVLAQRDVAITSAVAGTTRDVIEVQLDLAGYPVIVADTAGLREARDAIEAEGIRRARARAAAADLTIAVLDIAHPEATIEMAAELASAALVVANKLDLVDAANRAVALARLPSGAIALSTVTGENLPLLLDRLAETVKERYATTAGPVLTRSRHRAALGDCVAALRRSLSAPLTELAAEDLRLAVRALGRITGRADVEDILDIIFRDFCIGK
ncbi:MAG TPA: tRNA uridine-5-carboxymethylaminomethyl(34) synthesis GTPase MnmE [Stellaceae bacterium]|nr:tRNA uridine-5-carboxymethylaminomethyl(34) synthesis GTPase MnmE [Stellaceae bacterium]